MPRNVAPAILLALVSQGSGQFLRSWSGGFSYSSSGADSWTSSFFTSSSSWSRGVDGQVHHDVKETRTEDLKNTLGTQHVESKTICADGLCQQAGMKAAQPAVVGERRPSRVPTRMQMLMEQVFGRRAEVIVAVQTVPSPVQVVVPRTPQPVHVIALLPPSPVHTIGPLLPRPPLARPSLRGHPVVVVDDAVPNAPPQYQAPQPVHSVALLPPSPVHTIVPLYRAGAIGATADHLPEIVLPMCAFYIGLVVSMMAIMLVLLRLCPASAARELHLRTLAEPLAPVAECPQVPPQSRAGSSPVPKDEEDPMLTLARKYMLNVYARAEKRVEKRSIQEYMCSVYMRASA